MLACVASAPGAPAMGEAAAARCGSAEVVDGRTLPPLDTAAMIGNVQRTGRRVILYESPGTCGHRAGLAVVIAGQALTSLQAPILHVPGYEAPFPCAVEQTRLPVPNACSAPSSTSRATRQPGEFANREPGVRPQAAGS